MPQIGADAKAAARRVPSARRTLLAALCALLALAVMAGCANLSGSYERPASFDGYKIGHVPTRLVVVIIRGEDERVQRSSTEQSSDRVVVDIVVSGRTGIGTDIGYREEVVFDLSSALGDRQVITSDGGRLSLVK